MLQKITKENTMPGHYGKKTKSMKKGSNKLKGNQKKLPSFLKKKIMNSKRGK